MDPVSGGGDGVGRRSRSASRLHGSRRVAVAGAVPQHFRRVRRCRANDANWPSASRSPALAGAGHSAESVLQGGQTAARKEHQAAQTAAQLAFTWALNPNRDAWQAESGSLLMCRHDGAPTASPDQSRRALFPRHSSSGIETLSASAPVSRQVDAGHDTTTCSAVFLPIRGLFPLQKSAGRILRNGSPSRISLSSTTSYYHYRITPRCRTWKSYL
ncbi:hypothetical protein VTN96DRAFT_5172 [Rasamsonia emersonii]